MKDGAAHERVCAVFLFVFVSEAGRLRKVFGDLAYAPDAFAQAVERGRVGDAYETFRAESRAVRHDCLRFIEQLLCKVAGAFYVAL